jgi:hypothetical protein
MRLRTFLAAGALAGLAVTTLAASIPSGAADRARTASRSATAAAPSSSAAVGVSGGTGHACAVLESGAVACWGFDASSQNDGIEFGVGSPPALVSKISNASSISAGGATRCAVLSTGGVEC